MIDQVDSYINQVVKMGFSRKLKGSDKVLELHRIIKSFVDAQWLAEFDQRLSEYRKLLQVENGKIRRNGRVSMNRLNLSKDTLKDILASKGISALHNAIARVDEKQLDQEIKEEYGIIFPPFLCSHEVQPTPGEVASPEDQVLLDNIYEWIQSGKVGARRALKRLEKLKIKYPKMPTIYNFISAAYQTLGQDKKHYRTVKMTCKKFPDYLFGKIALAEYSISNGHHEKVPDIFGQKLHLHMHHPDTDGIPTFHGSQVQAFYIVMGRYYIRNQQVSCAIKCYLLVKEANENNPYLDMLVQEIVAGEMVLLMNEGWEEMDDD